MSAEHPIVSDGNCSDPNTTEENGKHEETNAFGSVDNATNENLVQCEDDLNNKNITCIDTENDQVNEVPILNYDEDAVPVSDEEDDAHTLKPPDPRPAEQEVDQFSLATEMSNFMVQNKINFGEIRNAYDMWEICDAISSAHGGLPDELLNISFLFMLETHLSNSENNSWNRQNFEMHISTWKRDAGKCSNRESKFVAASAEYTLPPQSTAQKKPKRRKIKASRKRALKALMGVAGTLAQAQKRFATEEGELEVNEDSYGNYKIGGEQLSFESWAALNRVKDSGIVHYNVPAPSKRRRNRPKESIQNDEGESATNVETPLQINSSSSAPTKSALKELSPANEKQKEVEEPSKKTDQIEDIKQQGSTQKMEEKDEGEISESGSESSSSSSSEDDSRPVSHHRRSKHTRKETKRHPDSGLSSVQNLGSIFSKCYELRYKIAQRLSLQQKAEFLEVLKKTREGAISEEQQQMTAQFMGSFIAFLQSTSR